jgi:hypothetical protein
MNRIYIAITLVVNLLIAPAHAMDPVEAGEKCANAGGQQEVQDCVSRYLNQDTSSKPPSSITTLKVSKDNKSVNKSGRKKSNECQDTNNSNPRKKVPPTLFDFAEMTKKRLNVAETELDVILIQRDWESYVHWARDRGESSWASFIKNAKQAKEAWGTFKDFATGAGGIMKGCASVVTSIFDAKKIGSDKNAVIKQVDQMIFKKMTSLSQKSGTDKIMTTPILLP